MKTNTTHYDKNFRVFNTIRKMFAVSSILVTLVVFSVPSVSLAQSLPNNPANGVPGGGIGSGDPKDENFQFVPCTGVVDKEGNGKECDFADLLLMAKRIIQFVLYIVTPIVIGMLLYTGFKYITAGGDAKLIADAKRMFMPILIGIFFIFAAWILVYTVLDKLLEDKLREQIVPESIRK